METIKRTIKGVQVTFNLCEDDLPRFYWNRVINDVKAVVSYLPKGRFLSVNVCEIDFYIDGQDPFNTMGYTEQKAFTHIHLNPRLYTMEDEITETVLDGKQRWYVPDSSAINFSRYIVAHEYAHRVWRNSVSVELYLAALNDSDEMIPYERASGAEAMAVAFGDWFMTKGQSDRKWTQDAARILRFPKFSEA